MGASNKSVLLLRRVLPLIALITIGLLAGLLVLSYNDLQARDLVKAIPNFQTAATCAVAFTGVAILSILSLTGLKGSGFYPERSVGTILLLTGGLFGLIEAGVTMDVIVLERLNPLHFSLSEASQIPIITRLAMWAAANALQLGFYIVLFIINRMERKTLTLRSVPGRRGRNGDGITESNGSQSVLSMVMEKSLNARQLPVRPPTPPTPMRLNHPSAFQEMPNMPKGLDRFAHELSVYPGTWDQDTISPVSSQDHCPPNRNSWKTSLNNSLQQVGRSTTKTATVDNTARSSVSLTRPSTDSRSMSMTNSFDEYWDHPNPPEVQIKDIFATSSTLTTTRYPNGTLAPSPIPSALETIPGSRPESPARETLNIGSSRGGFSQTSLAMFSQDSNSSASSISTITPTVEQTSFTPFQFPSHPVQRPSTAMSRTSSFRSGTVQWIPPQTSHSTMTTSTTQQSSSRPTTAYSTNTMTTVTTMTPSNYRSSTSRPPTPQTSYTSLNSYYNRGPGSLSPPPPITAESHIHPLFRSDSPDLTSIKTSPNTVVTASPFSGQIIGQIIMSDGSPPPVPPRALSRQSGKRLTGITRSPSGGPIPQFILDVQKERLSR